MDRQHQLFLDLDGVLADFDSTLLDCGLTRQEIELNRSSPWYDYSKMTNEQIEVDNKIRYQMAKPGFWREIYPMPDAKELWSFCLSHDPIILTARPRLTGKDKKIIREKREWVEDNLGPIRDDQFICCLRSEKKNFIGHTLHPNQILVDDLPANIEEWTECGGIGIIHKSSKNSIEQLKKYIDV